MTIENQHSQFAERSTQNGPHLVIQILSVIAFGIFSIVAVALAFSAFWLAGLTTTVVIALTWSRSRMFGGTWDGPQIPATETIKNLAPAVTSNRGTGNVNFDAYRDQMLEKLEEESRDFEVFLTRLRDAGDATEFETFLDERAKVAKETRINRTTTEEDVNA